jgi:hypothetical protein
LEWNIDFESAAPYFFGKGNCKMVANSAGYRTMLETLEINVDGQL